MGTFLFSQICKKRRMSPFQGRVQVPSIRLIGIDDSLHRGMEGTHDDFAETYGASLGESEGVVREVVTQTMALLVKAPRAPEWGCYLAADEEHAVVVGTCGFKHGPEADGSVEIAYFTFPGFEGRGYATAMAGELVKRALQSGTVRRVIAHTLPEPNASTRVLEKVGLHRVGEAYDAKVGRVWLWVSEPGGLQR
jgi:RimJ/RimL family protein N-acetyltransferase